MEVCEIKKEGGILKKTDESKKVGESKKKNIILKKVDAEMKKRFPVISAIVIKNSVDRVLKKFPSLKRFAMEYETAYRIFLCCCVLGHRHELKLCGPGEVIDELWHSHILHSEQYQFHCNKIFGSYLHHNPEDKHAQKKDVGQSALVEMINFLSSFEPWLKDAVEVIKIFNDPKLIACVCGALPF